MVQIINAFRGPSPIAETIGQLGKSLFGQDRLAGEINREKLRAAQRENTEAENFASRLAASGDARSFYADPANLGPLALSGYDPGKLGKIFLQQGVSQHGVRSPQADEGIVMSGGNYASGANAFDIDQANAMTRHTASIAENARQFDRTPVEALVGGQPRFVPRSSAYDESVEPVLSETNRKGTIVGREFGHFEDLPAAEQQYLGIKETKPGSTWNYVVDGKSYLTNDAAAVQGKDLYGNDMPPGGFRGAVQGGAEDVLTKSSTSETESKIMAGDSFIALSNRMLDLTKQDPTLFGPVGWARSRGQEVVQAGKAIAAMTGKQPDQLQSELQMAASAGGAAQFFPELYDRKLPEVELLGVLLKYSGASALAGQENRSVSDKDIQIISHALGDPHGWFASAESINAKMSIAQEIVKEHRRLAEHYLSKGVALPPPGLLAGQAASNVMSRDTAVPSPTGNPTYDINGQRIK